MQPDIVHDFLRFVLLRRTFLPLYAIADTEKELLHSFVKAGLISGAQYLTDLRFRCWHSQTLRQRYRLG